MGAMKSTLNIFFMPGCARISGSINVTIQTSVFIETLKTLSSGLHCYSWKSFYTQDHSVVVCWKMDLLLCFPGRVRSSGNTSTTSWMPWYGWSMIVRFTDLIWLFIMEVTWLFSSMRVIRWIDFYSRMVLYLTPAPRTMLS